MVVAGEIDAVGGGSTFTVRVAVAVQPFASVTTTVYTVVDVGLTVTEAVVGPCPHSYDVPPLAVSTTEPPLQMVALAGEIAAVGGASTFTVRVAEAVQPSAFVTVTV